MNRWNLVLTLIFGMALASVANAGDPQADPCAGIGLGFHESIDSQGFLGALTPKTNANLVRQALQKDIADSTDDNRFDWAAVCKLAKERGVKALWVGCNADTSEDSGEYYGSLAKRGQVVGRIDVKCVISTWNKDKRPSWGNLEDYALIHSGGDGNAIYPNESKDDGDRYDQLKKQDVRLDLYARALRNSLTVMIVEKSR